MKKIIAVLLLLSLMMSVNVFAEGENGNNQGLVYYEIITGEKVVLEDNSHNFNKTMEKWVTIASSTFKYFSDDLQLLSVKNDKNNVIVNFNESFMKLDPLSTEFSCMISSLMDTVFLNTDAKLLYIEVEGKKLEQIGEMDFSIGINNNSYIVKIDNSDFSTRVIPDIPNPVIVIDPGHGGMWNNAYAADGTLEKTVVLSVANYLKSYLEGRGATVIMTRTSDSHLSTNINTDLSMRADIANDNNADLFVSVHANGSTDLSANGVETFYPGNHDTSLSSSLADYITSSIGTRHSIKQRSNLVGNFAVLNQTEMIAVLTEIGFMSNSTDYSKMDLVADRQALAYSIYLGIREFWWGN